MNLRFWIWHSDGDVKITLKPGQEIALHSGGPNEEGYSYTVDIYRHAIDRVISECHTDSRDCDGPLSAHWKGECRADRLDNHSVEFDGHTYHNKPQWTQLTASRRDVYAESMGY
jgi:hypothetical protein